MTKPDPLQTELERLRGLLRPDRAAFAERQELHERHVCAFANQLSPAVRLALEQEGSAEVAAAWIGDARRMLTQWAGMPTHTGSQPGLPTDLDAARRLQEELTAALLPEACEPSEGEVADHSRELAQLLLSNWFSLLEHALQDHKVGLLPLDFDALPPQTLPSAVLDGCEAFALPPLAAAKALREFQQGLAKEGEVVSLSPTLHLLRTRNEWHLARSTQLAQASLRQEQTVRAPATIRRWRFEPVMQMLRPWALSRPMDLLGVHAIGAGSLTLADEQRIAMAAARTVLSGDDRSPAGDQATLLPPLLLHGIAEQVITDLGAAMVSHEEVYARAPTPVAEWQEAFMSSGGVMEDLPDTASLYRIVLSTAGLALAAGTRSAEALDGEHSLRGKAEEMLFACSVDTTLQVLADPNTAFLGQQIREIAGVESSQFGDLRAL